jgi:hypothetical protein
MRPQPAFFALRRQAFARAKVEEMLAVCPITSLPAFRKGGAKGGCFTRALSSKRVIFSMPPLRRTTST